MQYGQLGPLHYLRCHGEDIVATLLVTIESDSFMC